MYNNICNIENIRRCFDEVCRNTKNKKKVSKYKENKCTYVGRIYEILIKKEYTVGKYNVFTIYEPKKRRIVSQGILDKVVNHLVARHILYPALMSCLLDVNVASRRNMGVNRALKLVTKYRKICNIKYNKYYVLKCDISKFFESIDKDILKEKLKRKIKDRNALEIVYKIIDSEEKGLGIGNMTSQVFAVFYLNDMDHYIKEELKIEHYVRYQDDFLLFSNSKEHLKEDLKKLEEFLNKEKLKLNAKTRIYKNTDNYMFVGRNVNGNYANYRNIKRKLKKRNEDYDEEKISLNSYVSSKLVYKHLNEVFE